MLLQLEEKSQGWIRADSIQKWAWMRTRHSDEKIEDVERLAQQLDPLEDWRVKAIWARPLNGELIQCVETHAEAQPYWLTSCD